MFIRKTIGIQMFILLIGFFLAGVGFAGMSDFLLVGIMLTYLLSYTQYVLFLGLPALYIFMRRSAYLNRIIIATEEMAAGTTT